MSDHTAQCPDCPHPWHVGPCQVLHFYARPGGPPGNHQCMCGHPILQSTITMTPCQNCERLTAELAEARRDNEHLTGVLESANNAAKRRADQRDEARKQLTEAREILWMNHGHTMMYGDDGEMQCGECLRVGDRLHDYKREPLPNLVRHVTKIQAEARKQCDTLAAALREIRDYKVEAFDYPAEEWAKHTPETCAECKRWDDMRPHHPIQGNRCNGWYRLFYARERRRNNDEEVQHYAMRNIAQAALADRPAQALDAKEKP